MYFLCSELILITLIKQTNTTFVNLRGAFICFVLYNNILSLKVCFDRMALVLLIGIISIFFRSLVKISWPLSYFGIFMAIKEEGVSQLFLRIFPKKKNWAIKRPDMLVQGTFMLCLYYYFFLMSSYILKMFLLAMFGKLTIVLLESSLCFETAVKQFETS